MFLNKKYYASIVLLHVKLYPDQDQNLKYQLPLYQTLD